MTLLKNRKQQSIMDIGLFPLFGEYLNKAGQKAADGIWKLQLFLFGPRDKSSLDGNDKLYFKVTVASVIVSVFLGGISFIGSYTAGRAYAETHGVAQSVAAWIPISIDGFILLLVLIRFGGSLVGTDEKWVQFLMVAFASVSVLFNVSHIISSGLEATWQQWLLGAIFPIIVFGASEATANQITNYIKRKTNLKSNEMLEEEYFSLKTRNDNLQNEVDTECDRLLNEAKQKEQLELQPILDQIDAAKDELGRVMDQVKKESKREDAYTQDEIKTAFLMGQKPNATGQEVADLLGKGSAATGNNFKRKIKPVLNGEMK